MGTYFPARFVIWTNNYKPNNEPKPLVYKLNAILNFAEQHYRSVEKNIFVLKVSYIIFTIS